MICKDCEMEVDKLNKQGICKQCQTRINQLRYRNKKDGTNKPYVPVKDLKNSNKKEDLIEYKRIMNKRKSAVKIKSKETTNKVINTQKNQEIKELLKQEDIVKKDIQETFDRRGAKFPKDCTSILPIFEQLNVLLNNYINPYNIAEEILNEMELDYKHAKEYYSTMYRECLLHKNTNVNIDEIKAKKDLWEERHSILLEERRGIKNVLAEYKCAGIFFTELSQDINIKKRFLKYHNNLLNVCNTLSNKEYKAKMSSLVAEEDFCVDLKVDTSKQGKNKYQVVIITLWRNKRDNFVKNVYAETEEDAMAQVRRYLESDPEKFKFTCLWNESYVVLLEDNTNKECL